MSKSQPSTEDLFEAFRQNGDHDAFEALYGRTRPLLLRIARALRLDANSIDEAVQAVYVAAVKRAESFENGRPVLPWLAGILVMEARRQRAVPSNLDPDRLPFGQPVDPLRASRSQEFQVALRRAIKDIRQPYGRVLELHLLAELRPVEIAEHLRCSPSTVRTQLSRGMDLLRRRLVAFAPTARVTDTAVACGTVLAVLGDML